MHQGLTVTRSDGEAIAVNLPDLDPVETPEGVKVRLYLLSIQRTFICATQP